MAAFNIHLIDFHPMPLQVQPPLKPSLHMLEQKNRPLVLRYASLNREYLWGWVALLSRGRPSYRLIHTPAEPTRVRLFSNNLIYRPAVDRAKQGPRPPLHKYILPTTLRRIRELERPENLFYVPSVLPS